MAIYRYEFCDGTVNEVEVSDEWYALLIKMDKQEKNNDRRQTRRHVSLDYLNTFDLDIEAPGSDPITGLIKSEDKEELHKAINFLSPKQRKLITQYQDYMERKKQQRTQRKKDYYM